MEQKIALITGGSQGIGAATAELLMPRFSKIFTIARGPMDVTFGPKHTHFQADLSDPVSIDKVWEAIGSPIDTFVACAGHNEGGVGPFHSHDPLEWHNTLAVNLTGLMHLTQKVLQQMVPRKSGDIVFISSSVTRAAFPNMTAYLASKSGVEGFANGLRADYEGGPLKIITVQPGLTRTGFAKRRHKGTNLEAQSFYDNFENSLSPCQVAKTVEFAITQDNNCWIPEILIAPQGHRVC